MIGTRGKSGFMLVTVLIVTAVGLLFGAGALLLFRFQCQLRIDRQHELEKVYAVRSALNYTRTYTGGIPDAGRPFWYETGNGRNLGLLVKPVEPLFPNVSNESHFVMEEKGAFQFLVGQYNSLPDYEYGAVGVTNLLIETGIYRENVGLAFKDLTATNGVKWWVNIGMRDTGGWLQEDYGRRYFFWPLAYVDGVTTKDLMRLCLIRNVTNEANAVGRRHGWPLSQEGERALVFQVRPMTGIDASKAEVTFFEFVYRGGTIVSTQFFCSSNVNPRCNMGLQLAGNKVSVFYIDNKTGPADEDDLTSRGYTFLQSVDLSPEAYRYFAEEQMIGGKEYGGIFTNACGRVQAPELRAVFEVEAASDMRGEGAALDASNCDFLTRFRVTPAYQYDIYLEHPAAVTNRATVAQKIGEYSRKGRDYTMLTYDTHGTEHKGFRRDEREQARKNGR